MGEITHHYVKAEDWHSAQMSAYRMAQLMTGRLDWELASVWFNHAEQLALCSKDPYQLWRARAARLVVMRGMNLYDEGLALGKRVLHQATLHNWRATLGLAHHHIGEMYYDLGKLERSVEHIQFAHDIHEQDHDYDLAAAAQAMLSHATYRQGRYDVAREYARRSLAYSQELHNSWVRSEAMLAATNCDMDLGYYDDAINTYRAAIEIASMNGKLSNQLVPSINIGLALVMLGRYKDAIDQLIPTIGRLKTYRRIKACGQLYLGFALEKSGELEAALEVFQESAEARREPDPIPTLYDSLAGKLGVYIRLDDTAAVREHMQEIEEHIDSAGVEGLEDPCLVLLTVARAHEMLGDREKYLLRLEQAHRLVMQRAGRIEDAEASSSYVTRVPTNVEIRRRYDEQKNT
jgi:tetratricopeptide (TPR) repeat protein